MITLELFILCKLFIPNNVSYLWGLLFIITDISIQNFIKRL